MEQGDDLLDPINKVKALADQLACLKVPMRNEDVVMTLFESLSPLEQIFNHCFGNNANKTTNYEIRDIMLDA